VRAGLRTAVVGKRDPVQLGSGPEGRAAAEHRGGNPVPPAGLSRLCRVGDLDRRRVVVQAHGTDVKRVRPAAGLRPRPAVVIVLTDGYTPWPDAPPRGIRVVVGLLTEGAQSAEWPPPPWARTVVVDDPALHQ
jgi:hypothetical protein